MKIKETLAAEFDRFSDNYTEDMIRCVPHYQRLLCSISDSLPEDLRASRILDLGCGNGNVTALLLEKFPEAAYTLLDASPDMLELCRQRFSGKNITCVRSYFRDYTFPENYFDLITACFSLHHSDSEEKRWIFPRLFVALKPGGIFTCSDLMINKGTTEHEELIREWEAFVNANHSDGEKWAWLAEHYEAYDRPDDYVDQESWLLNAGFHNVGVKWRAGNWVHFVAGK